MPEETNTPEAPQRLKARDRLRLREEGKPVPPPPPLPPIPPISAIKPVKPAPAPAPAKAAPLPPEVVASRIAGSKAAKAAKPAPAPLADALKAASRPGAPDPEAVREAAERRAEVLAPAVQASTDGALEENTATEFNPGVGYSGDRVEIITPIYRDLKGPTAFALLATQKRLGTEKVGFRTEFGNAMIHVIRNRLAHQFLEGQAPWCLFLDDDMLPPIGNAAWFHNLTGTHKTIPARIAERHFLERLMSHNRPLVSATCFGRSPGAKPVFGAAFVDDLACRHARDLSVDRLIPTPWAGTGCLLVHRSVFEAIKAHHPHLKVADTAVRSAGYQWDFFRPGTGAKGEPIGEDAAFGLRAAEAGIKTFVDTGCQVLHIGNCAYGPHNTSG